MRYHIVTLFPEWFESPMQTALLAKAGRAGIVDVEFINPRDFTNDKHQKVDDSPYGGGPGMVLMAQPIVDAVKSIKMPGPILVLTPAGEPLTQKLADELAQEDDITLICGRYEGFDERIYKMLPLRRVSVGEAILNGGEVAALAIIEATARLQDGFMGKSESGDEESYSQGLLEYPHYTRPESYQGVPVPSILQSGNHAAIATWRHERALTMTYEHRPDLLDSAILSHNDREILREIKKFRRGKNIHIALLHYPILLKEQVVGTSSLTNLDIHDIARIACTYGVASFTVVTPLEDQKKLLKTIVDHWTKGAGAISNPDRAKALSLVRLGDSLENAITQVKELCGDDPIVIATSAKPDVDKKGREIRTATPFVQIRHLLDEKAVLIVLGTAHGLAPEALKACDMILPPLRWFGSYNHLPVRAACAIMLDRILGDRD